MLDNNKRGEEILSYLSLHSKPISGTDLANKFHVSRQVIVQDIALLRASNRNILSTNKGYILYQPEENENTFKSVIYVKHDANQVLEEFTTILEYGGKVLNVSIDHDLYGQIEADLLIQTMEDAKEFIFKMEHSTSKLLNILTDNCHYHTICAPSEKVMNLIKADLAKKGFLC